MIIRIIQKIVSFGTQEVQDPGDERRLRIINICTLLALTGFLLGFSTFTFMDSYYGGRGLFVFAALSSLVLFFNARRRYALAAILFVTTINLSQCYFGIWYGPHSGMYFYYFPFLLAIGLMYHKPSHIWQQALFLLITLSFFLVSLFVDDVPGVVSKQDIPAPILDQLFIYNLIISILLTALLLYFVIKTVLQLNAVLIQRMVERETADEQIRQSLQEKDILLAEVHHRVKNNLAIINGLLNLQRNKTNNEEAASILEESRNRIISMALIHEKIYRSRDFSSIELNVYLEELVNGLLRSYDAEYIKVHYQIPFYRISLEKAIPIGLIVNEVVTNTVKHAFRNHDQNQPSIRITTTQKEDRFILHICDNGCGYPPNFSGEDVDSLGVLIIVSLSEQLEGDVRFYNEEGACTEVSFRQ